MAKITARFRRLTPKKLQFFWESVAKNHRNGDSARQPKEPERSVRKVHEHRKILVNDAGAHLWVF